MAEKKRGKAAHPNTRHALLTAAKAPKSLAWRIKSSARQLGIIPSESPTTFWSAAEDRLVRRYYREQGAAALLAKATGRSIHAIRGTARYKGWAKTNVERRGATLRKRWTVEEELFLRLEHCVIPAAVIATVLGRSISVVTNRTGQLGLPKARRKYHHGKQAWSSAKQLLERLSRSAD
ncbi:hypothetical protein [Chitinolyticbacter meiyuanensis]|uniref:hypothetical protein n=1 Tax=Chitinolyticbacter meiyuanensis TaxID=682798 RepID=UPI0011E5E471|nr:hypothetical protein [Chitinolyticbacter meiyuanensis]